MKIEVHLLQNFAPSCLNRDDTGTPKECVFGGVRRARISSQSYKRALRNHFKQAVRTRLLIVEIACQLAQNGRSYEQAVEIVAETFKEGGIERPQVGKGDEASEKDTTKILLFFDEGALSEMVKLFDNSWDELVKKSSRVRSAVISDLGNTLQNAVKAPEIALFGRMIEVKSSTPFGKFQLNREASCQVAHPISTHRVDPETDFYSAVDDLNPKGESSAGMLGVIGFNSACFYRYAVIDWEALVDNLDGDTATARQTVEAFLKAMVEAIPTGKQNSMAAQNPADFGLFVARSKGQPMSLANAFVSPIENQSGLMTASIQGLDEYWGRLLQVYGDEGIARQAFFTSQPEALTKTLQGENAVSYPRAVQAIMDAVPGAGEGGAA